MAMQNARFNQPLQGHLLAFVLVIVLSWYTVVGTTIDASRLRSSGNDENRAEDRGERPVETDHDDFDLLSSAELLDESADDDEWPDIIYDEP